MTEKPTTDSLRILVAGRPLTFEEYKRWKRALRDPVQTLLLIAILALLVFFVSQLLVQVSEAHWSVPVLAFPLVAGCLCFLVLWFFRVRRNRRQADENCFLDAWYDEQAVRAGTMTAFYEDRLVHTTMRGSNVMYYDTISIYCETQDGFAVGDGRFTVYLRSADLTPMNADRIRNWLKNRLTPSIYRVKASAQPMLAEPLFIPRFINCDTVITRAAIAEPKPKSRLLETLGFVLPQMPIYGLIVALYTRLTPWPLLNCLIFSVGFIALGALLTVGMLSLVKPAVGGEQYIAFTKEGLAQQQNGITWFIVHARYRQQIMDTGVSITFSNGETLHIPWSAIEEPDKLTGETA